MNLFIDKTMKKLFYYLLSLFGFNKVETEVKTAVSKVETEAKTAETQAKTDIQDVKKEI